MFKDAIVSLTRQLFPLGRAFKMPLFGPKLISALGESEYRALIAATSILDVLLPDNASFSANDATDWERRLGMISNPAVSLTLRKAAILRKINFPGNVKARQSIKYIEAQLQAAGFNVYLFENKFSDGSGGFITKDPTEFGVGTTVSAYGDVQYGDSQYGGGYSALIVNSISETIDAQFSAGSNLRSTFYIGGATVGTFADVLAIRKDEFRQLILQLKPVQMVGFLFINYV